MTCRPVPAGYLCPSSLYVTIGSEVLYHDEAADEQAGRHLTAFPVQYGLLVSKLSYARFGVIVYRNPAAYCKRKTRDMLSCHEMRRTQYNDAIAKTAPIEQHRSLTYRG